MYRVIVALCVLVLPLSGCDRLGLPSVQLGEPRTLAAAAATAQERANRFSSGDYAGAWLLSSKRLQDAISQGDYVTFQQTCASGLTRLPVTAIGVRMDGYDRAIVREEVMGFKNSITMVYEDGKWLEAPSDFWIQNGGKPAQQLIAEDRATGHCGNNVPLPTFTSSTPSPMLTTTSQPPSARVIPTNTPVPTASVAISSPLPNAATSDVSAVRTGATAHLAAVRLHHEDGYDRLVLEFADRVPGYTVGYRPLPAQMDASGAEIPLPGASALVQVSLSPATADGWSGDARTYFGPSTVTADTATVTEAKAAGDFEAVLTWVAGLRAKGPFRVLLLDGPPRLVVDFQY